ncbi:MAG: quinolinate synthase NadA [Ruminococcus sp.]|nr:quinolinate synthase NadA [Ruminococcus sp.]
MTITEVQKEILRLKKEKDILILAHSYQSRDIIEIADIVGDSFALSVKAKEARNKTILMCGVRFMAETAKLLSPDKTVLLSSPLAGCPMAEQFSKEDILKLKEENPNAAVVCYVNTTAELKTVCDYCVTSSSALRIVKEIPNEEIIFIPDINLGSYVKENVPNKRFTLLQGGCPVHGIITEQEALAAKELHPNALLLVHPECKPEVTRYADLIGSTADIINFAKSSDRKEFIIGTEISIVEYLQFECPDKSFYPLSTKICCKDMKVTTLVDVLNCLNGTSGEEIILDDDTMTSAIKCINRMIEM